MDGAFVCDLVEACALFVGEGAGDGDGALDAVNEAFFVLKTLLAVF